MPLRLKAGISTQIKPASKESRNYKTQTYGKIKGHQHADEGEGGEAQAEDESLVSFVQDSALPKTVLYCRGVILHDVVPGAVGVPQHELLPVQLGDVLQQTTKHVLRNCHTYEKVLVTFKLIVFCYNFKYRTKW